MLCIDNVSTDPAFNLAAEEFLLKKFSGDVFMLWQNEPAVIVGKYQRVQDEVNLDFVKKNNISIIRRMTGGGAVYHDTGNLNFTFIENNGPGNFRTFSGQIHDILIKLGVRTEIDERNNLRIDGLKISGSAQCIHQNRILHHGTLLFSSELSDLYTALQPDSPVTKEYENQKSHVKSIRSEVTNILEYLPVSLSMKEFRRIIMEYFLNRATGNTTYTFSNSDMKEIKYLAETKYLLPEWNLKL